MLQKTLIHTALAVGALALAGAASAQTQGITDKEIVIGTHVDLSGPITFWGVPQRNGHIMRVEEINAAGGIHGRKIKLIVEDNGYDPKKGVLAAQKLVQRDKIFAMVGALGTPVAIASMPVSLKANVPHLFPGSNSRRMFEPFHKLKFSLASPYYDGMRAGVKHFVEKKGKKTIGILYQDDDFGKEMLNATIDQAKASGAKVVEKVSYKRASTSFSSQVARLKKANPDLVVMITVVRETVATAAEIKKLGWNVDVLAPASACNGAVPMFGKKVVENIYVLCQYVPFDFANLSPKVKAWADRYEKRFGKKANIAVAMAYNMQDIVAKVLQKVGRDVTVEKFIAELESLKGYQDMFGTPALTFGPKQHLGTTEIVLTQITGGKYKVLSGALSYK